MVIKAVYVDGWSTAKHKRITAVDDFLTEVRLEDGNKTWRDFGSREEVLECIGAVIQTMAIYISSEEMEQAIGTLPKKKCARFSNPPNFRPIGNPTLLHQSVQTLKQGLCPSHRSLSLTS